MNKIKIILGALCLCAVTAGAQTFQQDVAQLYADTIASTNSTYVGFVERKLTGSAWKAGGLWFFNVNDSGSVAVGGGFAREWTPNNTVQPSSFNLSVGLQLKTAIAPLSLFGITNKFAHPFVVTAVGTPVSGNNGGNLMNVNRAGVDFHFYTWTIKNNDVYFGGGVFYGNETGTGYYAGNWAGAYGRISWGSGGIPTLSDNPNANAWTTIADSQ